MDIDTLIEQLQEIRRHNPNLTVEVRNPAGDFDVVKDLWINNHPQRVLVIDTDTQD